MEKNEMSRYARHDIRSWRKTLIAALSVLFFGTMLAAVLMIAPFKAFAQEVTLLLPENTADYTINDVQNDVRQIYYGDGNNQKPYRLDWAYDSEVNVWSVSSPFQTTKLCLTASVTTSGTVAFEYLIDVDAKEENIKGIWAEKDLLSSQFVFTVTPADEAQNREVKTYQGTLGDFENHELEFISFEVEAGDTITFAIQQKIDIAAINSQDGKGNTDTVIYGYMHWYLHGLGDIANEIAEQYSPAKAQAENLSKVSMISNEITPQKSGTWNTDTEGEYYVFPEVFTGPYLSPIAQCDVKQDMSALNTYTWTFSFTLNGLQEISFDTWYWALKNGTSQSMWFDNCSNFTIKVDGATVHQEAGFNVNDNSQYSVSDKPYPTEDSERQWKPHSFQTVGDGTHTVLIEFESAKTQSAALMDEHQADIFFAFGIRNITCKEIVTKNIQFSPYDSSYGKVSYTVSGKKTEIPFQGLTAQIPENAEVTLTAEPKPFVKSSLVNYAAVRPVFTVSGEAQANNSYTFTVENDMTVNYSFKQQAPKPIVWAQILDEEKNEEGEAFLASTGRAIEIPGTGNPTLRLFLADYKDVGGTYSVKINGQTAMCEDVSGRTEIHLPAQLAESKVYLTARGDISEALEIEVTYSVEGVEAHSVTFRTEFTAQEKDGNVVGTVKPDGTTVKPEYSTNIYNNLFTEDSEQGAYFTSRANVGSVHTDVALWQPAGPMGENFTVETDSTYYGFHHISGGGRYWKDSILTLQLEEGRSGLITFDLKLSGARDAQIHAGVILTADMSTPASNSHNDYYPSAHVGVIRDWDFGATSDTTPTWDEVQNKFEKVRINSRLLAPTADVGAEVYPSRFTNEEIATVAPIGDGWFRVTVPTKATVTFYDGTNQPKQTGEANFLRFTLAFVTEAGYDASLKVRNVTFINASEVEITSKTSQGSVGSVGTDDLTDGKAAFGSTVKFTANVPQDKKLYGWSVATKKNNQTVSETFYPASEDSGNTFEYFAVQSAEVTAWIADENTYHVYLGGTLYANLNVALTAAAKDTALYKTVTALDSFAVEGAVTIPQGVTFLIPYNSAGQFTKMGGSDRIAWKNNIKPYLTVTFNGSVTVNGSLNVGGVFSAQGQPYQGHTSGEYSQLILKGRLTVTSTGTLDVYGRVTGTGSIVAESGGKVYQPFLILDFAGGTNTLGLFTAGQTPFKRYAMINIEVPMTINYGAQLIGHASLYAASMYVSLDQPFISDENGDGKGDTFVMLHRDASVTITYDPGKVVGGATTSNGTAGIGKTTMVFTGGADFSYMQFSAMGVSVPTKDVDFSIPYNYEIQLESGDFATKTKFKLMPGSIVNVKSGAKLTLNEDTYVYDGLIQTGMSGKSYPSAANLHDVGYNTNATLIVDGDLTIKSNITFLGVVQTTGSTGHITVEQGATLKGKIVDGALTGYDCNYSEYESSMRLYDKVHGENGQGTLVSVPVDAEGKAEKDMTFKSTWTEGDNSDDPQKTKKWTLPATSLKYDNHDYGGSTEGHIDHESKDHPYFVDGTTEPVTGMVGSWMVEHGDSHVYDWTLTEAEKNLGGAKYKDLHRQCTELGCTEKEHKLLLAKEDFTLESTYKGAAFSAKDLVKLFYKYYFRSEEVPADYTKYFSASVSTGSETIQNADDYGNLTVTLTNGFFGDVNKTSATFSFTVEKFNVANLDQAAIKESLSGLVYNGTAQTPELTLQADGLTGAVEHEALVWAGNVNAGENTASVTIKGSGTNFKGTLVVNFSIAKAQIASVEISGANSFTYNGKEHEVTLNVTANGVSVTDADYDVQYSEDKTNVGTVTVTVTAKVNSMNFTGSGETEFTITRAALTVTIEGKEHTYGETPAELTYTLGGVQNEEEESIRGLITLQSVGAEQWKDVGQYNITAWYKESEIKEPLNAENGDVLKNYTVTVKGGENAYTVERKSITGEDEKFTVTTAYIYDKTAKTPTMSDIKVEWEEYADKITAQKESFTPSYSNNTDAGDATVTLTASGNFTGQVTIHFTIGKATLENAEITTDTEDFTYNGQAHTVALKVTTANGVEIPASEYTVKYDDNVNAGTVTVTVTVNAESKNFADKAGVTATFAIAKAKVTVKADDQTTPQGEEILETGEFTYTVTAGQFFNQDETAIKEHFQYTTTANSEAVHDFDIEIGWAEDYTCGNYDVTFEKGTYHIIDAIFKNVTVTGTEPVLYDGETHTLTIEINNDTLNGLTTITITKDGVEFSGASDAGTYSLHVNIKADGYQTEYNSDFTLTITARKVTVTFEAQSSVYGEEVKKDAALTYTMPEGVLPKDQETFKSAIAAANPHTDATKTSPAEGSYKITADKPVLTNYDVTIADGVYTITARPVTVIVNKQTVTYNQQSQSASSDTANWSVTNLAAHEEGTPDVLKVKLGAAGKDAGAYDITATWTNTNYAVTFKGADSLTVEQSNIIKEAFVIEAAALTEATVTGSYTYNGQAQTPKFTVKAGELTVVENDFELVFAEKADRVSAGTVEVTVKAKSGNYSGSLEESFEIAAKKIKVTLQAQSFEYSGEIPTPSDKAYTVKEDELCSKNGEKDDLGVKITLVNGKKDFGEYGLIASASNKDYEVEFDTTAKLSVTKKQITVTADDLWSYYGDDVKEFTYTAVGLVKDEDPKTELHITLQADRTVKDVGTYQVTALTGTATNYTFEVTSGTYTVKEREVTVKINDQSSLYDGTEPSVPQGQGEDAGWTVASGSIIGGDNLHIVLTKAEGANAGKYRIDGGFTNTNYKVTFQGTMGTAGTYTITARKVTVKISDQTATYDPEKAAQHSYTFNGGAWALVSSEGDGLASGESGTDLQIALTTSEALENAGVYAITGSSPNTNYDVTFTGSYEGGKAGTYTIEKLDVSALVIFMLIVGEDGGETKGSTVRVVYAGDPLKITCDATLLMGGTDQIELKTQLSCTEIKDVGNYPVKVTIVDTNYCGGTEFEVIATDPSGYTVRLKEVLASLKDLAEGLDKDHLKAEDYETLLAMYKALAGLDAEELEAGAGELAEYRAYIDAWEALADTSEDIETAQAIANAPIGALFGAAAALTALAALAYVAFKGGML